MANAWALSALWFGLALIAIFQTKWREALPIGIAGFVEPFLGCTLVGHYVLRWSIRSSWLCDALHHLGSLTKAHYSFLVGAVIASAVLPTLIANTFFLPRHLLPHKPAEGQPASETL